jgi:hypothetical protein
MKYLEWADAEKTKRTEVLKKENQELLDLNMKEYVEAQQQVDEEHNAHYTCLEHHLGLWHLCCGKLIVDGGPPGANKPHQAAAQK